MWLVGAPLLLACTDMRFGQCFDHAYGPIGGIIMLVAGAFALFGFVSLLTYPKKYVPRTWGMRAGVDVVLEARAERQARFVFVAIVGLVLVVAEAFPFYSLVQVWGFDAVGTTADIALFAFSDLLVLFLVYLWAGVD